MKTFKNEQKEIIVARISEEEKYASENVKKRIEYACRACINHLAYELKHDGNNIYIQLDDRIRMIEHGKENIDIDNRRYIFEKVKCYFSDVKTKLPVVTA